MPLRQLKALYEKRKSTLHSLLKGRGISGSRREQIAGAISEIDSFLKTIETLREQEITDNRKLDEKNSLNLSQGLFKNIHEKLQSRFEGSQTRKNLVLLFLKKSETQARYGFYSKLAKNEGYESIAHVFKEFSEHEKEHARIIFRYLGWERKTKENLIESADLERQCHSKLYDEFEDTATKEKFRDIAEFIGDLSGIEAEHEKRFLRLLKALKENKAFAQDSVVRWKCRNCGHIIDAKEAPKKCKVCKKSQAFFEVHAE